MGEHSVSLILKDPDVWLGGDWSSQSSQFFKTKNIKAVLNCTPEVKHSFPQLAEYARVSLGDSRDKEDMEAMAQMLLFAAEWFHIHRDIYKFNILVHCNQGINRSASCLAAYLIKYKGMSLDEVKQLYSMSRQAAFYHGAYATFQPVLEEFEAKYRSNIIQ